MARYRLHDALVFDDTTSQLAPEDEPQESIRLSATAGRCLKLLIERQGEQVDKKTLMHECWGKYGSHVTESSMWKDISQLRQAFLTLNIPIDVIVTVPRIGYTFSSAIKVELLSTPSSFDTNTHPEIMDITEIPPLQPTIRKRSNLKPVYIALFACIVVNMFAAAGYYFYKLNASPLPEFDSSRQYRFFKSMGETQVFLQYPLEDDSIYATQALARFENEKPKSMTGHTVRYLYINRVISHAISSYFLCNAPITESNNRCSAYFSFTNQGS